MSQQSNKQNLPTTTSNLSSVNIQDYSQNNQVQQSLQNQQLQMRGQQQRTQMQQAPQGSPVPMNTIAQQSPQLQMQQQSVQSPSQQQQSAQTSLQQQPSIQPSPQQQSSLSPQVQPNIAAGTVVGAGRGVAAVRGGAKKKGATTTRKTSTGGGRAKATPFEKSNEDSMLPQALNRMATDFFTQAQKLGVETAEGQKMLKKYEDTVRAIQQVNLNNQTATSYNLSMTQDQTPSSLTSTSSPHTVTRSIAATTTISSVTPQLSAQQLQQSIQQQQQAQHHLQNRPSYQQLLTEINRIQEALSQPNINPTVKQEYENRLHMLNATISGAKFQALPGTTSLGTVSHMPPQSPRFMNHQVVRSSIQANMNSLGQNRTQAGNDLNRIPTTTSQQITSPILPSTSMATGQLQDVSMMSTSSMQHQLGQQTMLSPRLHQIPQSPSTQPPQSSLIQQQLQQHQPTQSIGSNEDMMDIDTEPAIIARKTAELLATSSVVTATPRQVPPIAPAINTNVLPSTLLNQAAGKVPTGKTPANIFGNNASFPETPASTVMDVDVEDAGTRHLLPKRKVQQLVNQIDPKERLEPEVEEMLLEIADEFISSVASFACLLAKHRKSDTLEVKDLQLHLERNWNIRIPGFASDEIRSVRKPVVSTSHQQKLAAVMQAKANKVIAPSS